MKQLMMTLLVLASVGVAQAGSTKYTCRNKDGSMILTRDKLVLLRRAADTQQFELSIFTHVTSTATPGRKGVLQFIRETTDPRPAAELRVVSVTYPKPVADSGNATCPDGQRTGFSTESYSIKGQFSLDSEKERTVELSCLESTYWGSTCGQ